MDALEENPNHIFARFNLEYGLQLLVNEPTRENSILDLLLCDCASTVSNVHNLPIFLHQITRLLISLSIVYTFHLLQKKLRIPDYKWADWPNMLAMLSSVNWCLLLSNSNNIQQYWDSFYDILYYAIATFEPTKSVTILSHRKKVLVPLSIKRLRSKKLTLWRLLREKSTNSHVKFKFKRAAKALKSAIIKWRLEKESALITPTNKFFFLKVH